METIVYQGQAAEAELVGEINTTVAARGDTCEGNEALYRDAGGQYYLQHEAFGGDYHLLAARENPRAYDYRCRVHRLSLRGAILWAIRQLGNGSPWNLLADASDLFTAERQSAGKEAVA